MYLTIALPGFFWQDPGDIDYLYPQIKADNFKILVKAAKLRVNNYSYANLFYTVNTQLAQGSLAKQLSNLLQVTHEYKYFLIAEPTHLRLDRDRLLISESELLQLSNDEEIALINLINQHFAQEIKLYYVNANLWLIGHNINIEEHLPEPILNIIGENIDEYITTNIHLNKLINEIQMLLFSSTINMERQQEGSLTVNSLWLSDIDIQPHLITSYTNIFANNFKHLTNHAKISPMPTQIETAFIDKSLIIVDSLYFPCCYRDSFGWFDKLDYLDKTVGVYLKQFLSNGKIRTVEILIPSQNKTLCLIINSRDKYKFWQNKQLIDLVKDSHAL